MNELYLIEQFHNNMVVKKIVIYVNCNYNYNEMTVTISYPKNLLCNRIHF